MRSSIFIMILSMAFVVGACSNQESKSKESETVKKSESVPETKPIKATDVVLNDSLEFLLMRQGKKVVHESGIALKMQLKSAIKERGIEGAISFCNTRAMEITDSLSRSKQVRVQRLAKKYRNPLNNMVGNDSLLFKNYIVGWMNGVEPQPELGWDTDGHPIYYHPIKVEAICLNCHGSVEENIPSDVATKIAQLYPDDRAVDFKVGDLRGMWAVTFPEYRIIEVDLSRNVQ